MRACLTGVRARPRVTLTARGCRMKRTYESPRLVVYGHIADNTFTTPGGVKGCKTDCHLDSFTELSANSVGS